MSIVKKHWQEIRYTFNLSLSLAKADFKLKNEGSYLGIIWYLLNPILTFALLFLVFNDRLGQNISNYPLYLLFGIVMFNFFQNCTYESVRIIRESRWIIKSINFPIESLILGIILKNLFSHFFELIVVVAVMLFFHANFIGVIFYPIILLFFMVFIFGVSLILSSLTAYFNDIENVWNFGVRLLWLGTPIFYAIEGQTRLFYLNLFNPMYYFITITRDFVIYSRISDVWLLLAGFFYSLFIMSLGFLLFRKLKTKISEKI
jgi:lipopolysaccharide transport system permease protein